MAAVTVIETIKEFLDERQPEHTYAWMNTSCQMEDISMLSEKITRSLIALGACVWLLAFSNSSPAQNLTV